jgi:hypothetical protein
MKKRQQGLSLIGMLLVGGLAAFVLLVGFRCVPAITEYMSLKRIVVTVAQEGDSGASIQELRRSFDRRASVGDVSTVTGKDLEIYKQGGKVVVEVSYGRKVPIIANVSLFFDFFASSQDN